MDTNTSAVEMEADVPPQVMPNSPHADGDQVQEEETRGAVTGVNDTAYTATQSFGGLENQLACDAGSDQAPSPANSTVTRDGQESPSNNPIKDEGYCFDDNNPLASPANSSPSRIPDLTEGKMLDVPQIRDRYDAYQSGWSDPLATYEGHMQRAKDLAIAMLNHYFPKNQGFSVKDESFDVMTANGWNFPLDYDKIKRAHDGRPIRVVAKPKSNLKLKTGGKKRKRSNSVKEEAVEDDKAAEEGIMDGKYLYKPDLFLDFKGTWCPVAFHKIPRERLAGFVVNKRYIVPLENGVEVEEDHAHTYLAIIIDDLLSKPLWIPTQSVDSSTIPADIMSYSLGVHGKIQKGYGILMLGKNLEFYKYDNKEKKPMQSFYKDHFSFDMTKNDQGMLTKVFDAVASSPVSYQNGVIGTGPRKDIKIDSV